MQRRKAHPYRSYSLLITSAAAPAFPWSWSWSIPSIYPLLRTTSRYSETNPESDGSSGSTTEPQPIRPQQRASKISWATCSSRLSPRDLALNGDRCTSKQETDWPESMHKAARPRPLHNSNLAASCPVLYSRIYSYSGMSPNRIMVVA
jgi:hypothetical protein